MRKHDHLSTWKINTKICMYVQRMKREERGVQECSGVCERSGVWEHAKDEV